MLDVLQKPAPAAGHLADCTRIRVVPFIDVEAIFRNLGHSVHAVLQQTPERLRISDPTWKATGHADDGNRLIERCTWNDRGADGLGESEYFDEQVSCNRSGRRMVEGERRRDGGADASAERVAELDGHQRVEAEILERFVGGHVTWAGEGQHARYLGLHGARDCFGTLFGRQRGELACPATPSTGGAQNRRSGRGPAKTAEHQLQMPSSDCVRRSAPARDGLPIVIVMPRKALFPDVH